MNQLQGKVAIVTGAAGGFGEGIARLFVAEGAKVLIADLDGDKAQTVAASLGAANARAVRCDVSKRADIDAAVKACVDAFGVPDIVVNNAGTTHKNQPMLETDEATFDRVFAVNVLSKSMAVELGPDNIRVNAVCPVMGATGLIEQFLGTADTPEARAKIVAGIPLGRMSTPEDVAQATLYLASDAACFITGVELPVDGGRTI